MNCPHHIQWIVPVNDGLHQCLQCTEVVTKKDVTPRFEELGPEVQKRWDAHEASAKPRDPAVPPPVAS